MTVSTITPDGVPADIEPLLDLVVRVAPNGQATSRLPIRWWNSAELNQEILDKELLNPHLLLVIRTVEINTDYEQPVFTYTDIELREVPLLKQMDYITFKASGTYQIVALVVDITTTAQFATLKNLKSQMAHWSGESNYWDTQRRHMDGASCVSVDGLAKHPLFRHLNAINLHVVQGVVVTPEMFAPPPPENRRKIVRTYFKTSERDECQFKFRFGISVVVSTIVVPTVFCMKLLTILIALFAGLRGISFRPLFDLLDLDPLAPMRNAGRSWWYRKTGDEDSPKRPFYRRMLSLPSFTAIALGVYVVCNVLAKWTKIRNALPWLDMSLGWALLFTLLGFVVAGLVVAAVIGIGLGISFLFNLFGKTGPRTMWVERKRKHKAQERADKQRKADERKEELARELAAMAASGTPDPSQVSINALPWQKRTVHLHYQAFKGEVCRRYPQQ